MCTLFLTQNLHEYNIQRSGRKIQILILIDEIKEQQRLAKKKRAREQSGGQNQGVMTVSPQFSGDDP